jgi:hypothetical protein
VNTLKGVATLLNVDMWRRGFQGSWRRAQNVIQSDLQLWDKFCLPLTPYPSSDNDDSMDDVAWEFVNLKLIAECMEKMFLHVTKGINMCNCIIRHIICFAILMYYLL